MQRSVILLVLISVTNSEWVEIPQISVQKETSDVWSTIQQSKMFSDFLSKNEATKSNLMNVSTSDKSSQQLEEPTTAVMLKLNENILEVTTPLIVTAHGKPLLEKQTTTMSTLVPAAPVTVENKPTTKAVSKHQNTSATVKQTTPKVVRKMVVAKKPKSDANFGISGIIKYIKDIQKSFATTASRSIQDKVKMLKSVRDEILLKLGECRKTAFIHYVIHVYFVCRGQHSDIVATEDDKDDTHEKT